MDPATDDTVKQEKAAAQQASRTCSPSWFCTFSLLAFSFYSFRALSALAPRPVVLHAVPESELVAVSLPVNPELFSAAIKSTGKKVVFGKPTEPLQLPTDFVPPALGGPVAKPLVAARSPSTPPPSPPPPPEGPKPWVVEAQLPPRPKNASRAAAAMARAAAATRAARAASNPRTDAAQQLALPADERLALVSPPADGDASESKLSLTALSGADAGQYAYEVLDARPGTLLIGGEGAFGEGENYYNGAVVLLVKVCGCNPSIFGVILNRPAAHTMAEEFCPRR